MTMLPDGLASREGASSAMKVVTPDLYCDNGFRILGLCVDASNREITKQSNKLKIVKRLGRAVYTKAPIFPIRPSPDEHAIAGAIHELRDAEARLHHEFFWFWPLKWGESGTDPALNALRQGQIKEARRLWKELAVRDAEQRSVAIHNIAVLHHLIALDGERALEGKREPKPKHASRLDKNWRIALKYWAAVVENDGVWERVEHRIAELNDPRLTHDMAARLRESLPAAILSVNVELAVRWARRGNKTIARRHLAYIRHSGLDPGCADRLLEEKLRPSLRELESAREKLLERAQADPGNVYRLVFDSWNPSVKPPLALILTLLHEEHPLRVKALDQIAQTLCKCAQVYWEASQDWRRYRALLKNALKFATSEELRETINEALTIVEMVTSAEEHVPAPGNYQYQVTLPTRRQNGVTVPRPCTCCFGEADSEEVVSCSREEQRGGERFRRTLSLPFPVCSACRGHRQEYAAKRCLMVLLSVGASLLIIWPVASLVKPAGWFLFVILGAGAAAGVLLLLSTCIRLSILGDEHASRGASVSASFDSGDQVTFTFSNPRYASLFAHMNQAEVVPSVTFGEPRGSFVLSGGWAVITVVLPTLLLALISHLIFYASTPSPRKAGASASRREHSRAAPNAHNPPRRPGFEDIARSSPRAASRQSRLFLNILSGKARVKRLESEIGRMDAKLQSLENSIEQRKEQIDAYESRLRGGIGVNRSIYQQAIDDHNNLVRQYNALLQKRSLTYAEYLREIDAVNDMVRRYNTGER